MRRFIFYFIIFTLIYIFYIKNYGMSMGKTKKEAHLLFSGGLSLIGMKPVDMSVLKKQ